MINDKRGIKATLATRSCGSYQMQQQQPPNSATALTLLCSASGPGHVPHRHVPAQLSQGGRAARRHVLPGAGQSSHRRRIRTLQQPHGLQHQPAQYGQPAPPRYFSVIRCRGFLNNGSSLFVL